MSVEFRITLHARIGSESVTFGEFFIRNDRQAAKQLFDSLNGSPEAADDSMLTMELREINFNLPFKIKMIKCTLDQLAENCRRIAKDRFNAAILKTR